MKLSADLVEAFAGMYLSPRYDDPRQTPQFHREAWELYCSDHPACEVIAPRDHAKSTALTFDYVLANALFGVADYIILIGSTEEMAQENLSNISAELHDNEDLQRDFGPITFETDQKTEVIVKTPEWYFRILARGGEQKIRGRLWNGKRPDLLVCDDLEDDEQVESKERRAKFRRWFFRAAKQALGKGGRIRVHGTILHEDSLLSRLRKNSAWKHLFYKAHESFDDFSNILWPERWSEAELRAKRQEFIDDNDASGYSQEILNDPLDNSDAYLRKDDFIAMEEDDYSIDKLVCAAWDFATSQAEHHDNTSCTVGGKCIRNLLHIIDQRKGRWDAYQVVNEVFSIQNRWKPDIQFVEAGTIWNMIAPMLYKEMAIRDIWINFQPMPSSKDKATRGRVLQRRHRGGGIRFDKQASWYADYEHELLRFTEGARAILDDQFDSTSLLARGFEGMSEMEHEDFESDEEHSLRVDDPRLDLGRNVVTGY